MSRFDVALRWICGLLPAGFAAAGATTVALAAHDEGVVRVVGAGFTGPFHALDFLVAAPAMLLPFGTRAFRAGLASAAILGVAGALAFDWARGFVQQVLKREGSRLGSAVAALAVLAALLGPAWQTEGAAPGGAVTGALVVLAMRTGTPAMTALGLGLAASYDPFVFLAALAVSDPRALWRGKSVQVACSFVLGLLPFAVAMALGLRSPAVAAPARVATSMHGLLHFAMSEVGWVFAIAGVVGIGLAFSGKEPGVFAGSRRLVIPLAAVVLAGGASIALGAPAGPNHFGASVLLALLALHVAAAAALGGVVLLIARAPVPFAEASAALVVVLELVLPVRALDDATIRRDGRSPHAAAVWDDIAWGQLPPASVLTVASPRSMLRIASARAAGNLRGDLVIVPSYDVQGRAGELALLAEPKLAALYRDLALGVPPEELSLAQLGAQRPVIATFDPKWDRALARHLVPSALGSLFEPEPRGASDRKKALDGFASSRDRLVKISVAKRDPELASASALFLRARAIGMAATGEHDILAQALDDLRAVAPDDQVHATLVRRMVTTKGPIDVRDL